MAWFYSGVDNSLIEIEGNCRCDADGREVGVSTSIVASGDAPPVLELRKHILEFMALFVERLVIGQRDFPAFGGRYSRFAAPLAQGGSEPIAVIAAIGKKRFGRWQGIKDQPCPFVIAHLSLAEHQDKRLAFTIADGMELRVQAAFRAPNAAGNSPFFKRLAAVRCAFRWVASIITRSGFGPSPARAAKIWSNTPSRLQRMKRL